MCVVLLGDRPAIDVRGDAGHGQGRTDRVRQDLPGALLIVPSTLGSKSFLALDPCCTHRIDECVNAALAAVIYARVGQAALLLAYCYFAV
jgi:hypothetical protein